MDERPTSRVEQPTQGTRTVEPALVSLLFSRAVGALSLAGIVLSFALPRDGLGVSLCWFASNLHLPCPGCGLTRSVISVARLDLWGALHHNPFGIVGYGLFVATVALSFAPRRWTAGLRTWLGAFPRLSTILLNGLVLGLLVYGAARLSYYLYTGLDYLP